MVLDAETLDLSPTAAELLAADAGAGVKLELPASQLEVASAPHASVAQLVSELYDGRARLAAAVAGAARLAAVGAHPFASAEGQLNDGPRYARLEREYGSVVRRQLICGLHVHVGIDGAERALAVYNALRGYLPEIAALAANAPLRAGRDTGMASVRPLIAGLLPRQGVPPAYANWEELAADLAWGHRAGRLMSVGEWWWELRIHAQLGTIEVRAPDAQSHAVDAAALIAFVAALVLWLGERFDADELPAAAASWRIAENRWSAARHGVHGRMVDLDTGAATYTTERLHSLLEQLLPTATRIGAGDHIGHAHALADCNGADRQRAIAAEHGVLGLMTQLSDAFHPSATAR
jgi:glutamate---cysteine ligase / carboxylate-amine ligase